MFKGLINWYRPAKPIAMRPQSEIDRTYRRNRWRVFESAFLAYAMFYMVRNNLSPVAKEMGDALMYDKSMLGLIMAGTAISYGMGKFIMGFLSDQCDARKYVATGLLATSAVNFIFGSSETYLVHLILWSLNGFIQGMGYGPCCRGLSHWFSFRERGTVFGLWNMSHNLGGGMAGVVAAKSAEMWGWSSAFYVPGAICTLGAVYLFLRMRDTPQSIGLPAIEDYKNDWPPGEEEIHEKELSLREMMFQYILPNKMLWILALANIFVYVSRYAMLDWGPTYLKEVKGATITAGGISTLVIEFSGALGMLTMGWLSDKLGGYRARVSVVALLPLPFAFYSLRFIPADLYWLEMGIFAVIGFLVYVPVMFSGVMSLDLTSKKAVGTAAGFVGFFGYVGRVLQGFGLGYTAQHYGWNAALLVSVVCACLAIVLLAFLWNVKAKG